MIAEFLRPQAATDPKNRGISGAIFDSRRTRQSAAAELTTFLVTVVTMTGEQGVKAVEITKPRTAIPIHHNDFSVFLSGLEDFKKAAEKSSAATRFVYLAHV